MDMRQYNKLVRDRIPDIIRNSGKQCLVRVLEKEDYMRYLKDKLSEELGEYLQTEDVLELVDLVEVIYAILAANGMTLEKFEELRVRKRKERGGFEKRLFLVSVDSD